MQKVIVQIDWYTKVILTLIVVLLAGILAKPYIVSKPVEAYGDYVTVGNGYNNPVPVVLTDVSLGPLESLPVRVVENWASKGVMPVEVVNIRDPYVEAHITGSKWPLTVVDWKEKDDYYDYLRKQREKRE